MLKPANYFQFRLNISPEGEHEPAYHFHEGMKFKHALLDTARPHSLTKDIPDIIVSLLQKNSNPNTLIFSISVPLHYHTSRQVQIGIKFFPCENEDEKTISYTGFIVPSPFNDDECHSFAIDSSNGEQFQHVDGEWMKKHFTISLNEEDGRMLLLSAMGKNEQEIARTMNWSISKLKKVKMRLYEETNTKNIRQLITTYSFLSATILTQKG